MPYKSKIAIFSSILILAAFGPQAKAEKTILANDVNDKLRGMWLGQLIGNAAGRETEGNYSGSAPNLNSAVPWVIKTEWDGDDDTDIEYIAMHILTTHGFDCNSQEISNQWLEHITSSGSEIYIANRQAWYLMKDGFLPPQTGSRNYNEHWYAIDSQITTETIGAVSPGLVQSALDTAGKFARISNEGFPVHASQLFTSMYANAFFEPNVITLVRSGLNAIPVTSRTHQVAEDVLNWYLADANDGVLDWRATRKKLYDYYQGGYAKGRYYLWVESTINTGATIIALLYGRGDFKETVQIGVLAGWDCDCNPAIAAGVIGIINGYGGLPPDLTDPNICGNVYKNVYRPYLPDPCFYIPQYETITNIASRLTGLAEQNILNNGGFVTGSGPTKTFHIPDSNTIITEPENPDPNGPAGLVAAAIGAGMTVTASAAVEYHTQNNDRRNLDAIIDGIADNSYNGRKAYYSYVSDPNARLAQDWYRLNFSAPVKFDGLTFYEGDIVWQGINTYYKSDNTRGGFFNDLTVEILRDGKFIVPADLQMSENPDRYKMYQTISFSFAPTIGQAIRIIGTAGGSEKFTTILELEAWGDINPGFYVSSVQIAGGQLQRSTVKQISIQFSRNAVISRDDIDLVGIINGTIIDMNNAGFDYDGNTFRLTLSFSASLPDDSYELSLDCDSVTDTNGLWLLDDDQNPYDGYYTIKFHRLFGDADGSGEVDFDDIRLLTSHWLDDADVTGLDANNDDAVNFLDFAAFAENWFCNY